MSDGRFPKHESPFQDKLAQCCRRFEEAREEFLSDYGYNTARAYWGDLDDLYDWCERRGFDIFELTAAQFRQYQASLWRRRYSESTIRRRRTARRGLVSASGGTNPGH